MRQHQEQQRKKKEGEKSPAGLLPNPLFSCKAALSSCPRCQTFEPAQYCIFKRTSILPLKTLFCCCPGRGMEAERARERAALNDSYVIYKTKGQAPFLHGLSPRQHMAPLRARLGERLCDAEFRKKKKMAGKRMFFLTSKTPV